MHLTENFQRPATRSPYETPKLLRFGRVTVLTKSGTGSMTETGNGGGVNCGPNRALSTCASDARLKRDIVLLHRHDLPHEPDIYAYRYVPSLHPVYGSGIYVGVMAQEVREIYPEVVIEQDDGYLAVDYARLNQLLAANTRAPAHAA